MTSSEKNALRLLRALKKEQDSGKTLLTCRPLHEILDELKLTEANERNHALDFLARSGAIQAVNTQDRGRFALPSSQGLTMLAADEEHTEKAKEKKIDRRLKVLLALFAAAVALTIGMCVRH